MADMWWKRWHFPGPWREVKLSMCKLVKQIGEKLWGTVNRTFSLEGRWCEEQPWLEAGVRSWSAGDGISCFYPEWELLRPWFFSISKLFSKHTSGPSPCGPDWLCFLFRFQFGGKLVTFENGRVQAQQGAEPHHHVFVSQVVTEEEFLRRSDQLQQVVRSQGFVSYCQKKIEASQTEFEKNVWSFLKVKLRLKQFHYLQI